MSYIIFFFFFSSRRRHTRWPRDWSSDVCSSDLGVGAELSAGAGLRRRLTRALRFLDGGEPLIDLGEELDQPVDGWRRVRPGRAADESADVVELVVDQRFLEHPGGHAGNALARPARVLLRLARQPADLGRDRERGLALDRLH